MRISSLSVQDFRSTSLINLKFSKNISVLYGHNNVGKTTILEAIYFCSNLKSYNSYFGYKGISYGEGEIVFLDQDAVKALCIGYPTTAKLILISLRDFKLYIFILIEQA